MAERTSRTYTPVSEPLPDLPVRDQEVIFRIKRITNTRLIVMLKPLWPTNEKWVMRFAVWDLDKQRHRMIDIDFDDPSGRDLQMGRGRDDNEGIIASVSRGQFLTALSYALVDLRSGEVTRRWKKRICDTQVSLRFIDESSCRIAFSRYTIGGPELGTEYLCFLSYPSNVIVRKKDLFGRASVQLGNGHMAGRMTNGCTIVNEAKPQQTNWISYVTPDGWDTREPRYGRFNMHEPTTIKPLSKDRFVVVWENTYCYPGNPKSYVIEVWGSPTAKRRSLCFKPGYRLLDGADKWLLLRKDKEAEVSLFDVDAKRIIGRYGLPRVQAVRFTAWEYRILPGDEPGFVYTLDRRVRGCEAGAEVVRFKRDRVQVADERGLQFGEWNLRGLVETLRLPPQAALPFYIPRGANRLKCTLYRLFEQYPVAMQVGLYDWVLQEPERLTPAVVELMFNNLDNVILLKFPYSLATLAIKEGMGDVATFRMILVEGLRVATRLPMPDEMFRIFTMTIKEAKEEKNGWIKEPEYIVLKQMAVRRNLFDSKEWQGIEREIRELKAQVRVNRMNIATLAASIDELKAAMAGKRNRSVAFRVLRAGLALVSAGIGGLVADGVYDGLTGLVNLGDITSLGARILGVTPEKLREMAVDMQGAVDLGIDPDEYFHRELRSLIREKVKDWVKDGVDPGETEVQVEAWAHEALTMIPTKEEPQEIPEIPLEALRAYSERLMGQGYQFEAEEEEEMIVSCTVVPEGHEPPDLWHLCALLGNCLRDGRVEVEAEVLRARPKRQVAAILKALAPTDSDSKAEANQCVVS